MSLDYFQQLEVLTVLLAQRPLKLKRDICTLLSLLNMVPGKIYIAYKMNYDTIEMSELSNLEVLEVQHLFKDSTIRLVCYQTLRQRTCEMSDGVFLLCPLNGCITGL
jgi:hypothetical protein